MGLFNYFIQALTKKYAQFNGRARRKEYWGFMLFDILFELAIQIITAVIEIPIAGLYTLAVLLPGIAVAVRRMHDIGKSGWWFLIALIPIIGPIWFIILAATPGVAGPNQFGDDPKALPDVADPNQFGDAPKAS